MRLEQMVWHAYHSETLCQLVNLEARRKEIEEIKPEHELPTRRRLMKPVVGELPEEFVQACVAELELWEAVRRVACDVSYAKYKTEIERLHVIECPDCPWDGETIFPEAEDVWRCGV